jgi:ParB family chromosome partitioning protein
MVATGWRQLRRLGALSIAALIVVDREVAWQILALNTEKVSPYLRSFVVARINPLRWIKGDPPPLEDMLKTMRERAAKFNVANIKPQDLAGATGPPDEV